MRLCLDHQGFLGDAGHVVAVACSEVGIRQALRVCASTHREFLEMVEEQCNFLSKDFSNSSAFSWAYTLSRVFSEWEYTNPAGPTIADHRVVLLRLLVAGLPMAGAYASDSLRPSARATRERGGGPPTGFWGHDLAACAEAVAAMARGPCGGRSDRSPPCLLTVPARLVRLLGSAGSARTCPGTCRKRRRIRHRRSGTYPVSY